MSKFFLTILLLTSVQGFAQFDYDIFKDYTEVTTQERNKKLISTTEYQQDKGQWIKTSLQQFNSHGLPTTLIQYDQQAKEAQKKEFIYDSLGNISKIKGYKNGTHDETTEFDINSQNR